MKTLAILFVVAAARLVMAADAGGATTALPREVARQAIAASGVHGGLVVHLDCGDGQTTAALCPSSAYLVHGLAATPEDLAAARKTIRQQRRYGVVSVDLLTGPALPYVDNSVNLLIAGRRLGVRPAEIQRVLTPRGVALIAENGGTPGETETEQVQIGGRRWLKVVKPWPAEIDEWTHYLHDSTNNAVAQDTAIGPLRHLQWEAGPRYSRHHEYTSSVAGMVSARGRLFSMIDMASRASIQLPAKWQLIARDAFNGVKLWQVPIESWFNHLWPLKSGPAQPPRRLVAVGDRVYVTLGIDAPVSRLNAATGEIEHVYPGTEFTEEILYVDGTLVLLKGDKSINPRGYYPKRTICWDEKARTMKESEGWLVKPTPHRILALNAESGKRLWETDDQVEPLTLTADRHHVYFHNWDHIVCLDRRTGQPIWQSPPVAPRETMGYVYGPTLVAWGDVVLFADGRRQRKIHAFSKRDGTHLWQAPHYAAGHAGSPEDLLVVDGLVWCGKIAGGGDSGLFVGRDPNTGEVKRQFTPDVQTYWFHHRCHRAKATTKYILTSRTGIELVDVHKQSWDTHHWVRGACSYGILPCNGLVYAPPHPCACYSESKLSGLNALAPASQRSFHEPAGDADRLRKGPAYGATVEPDGGESADWPTYRHDAVRSGVTKVAVPLPLGETWRAKLSGRLTAPVVAGGRVYVAEQDAYAVDALCADNGDVLWRFTTGGRVDSPPTVAGGRVIFGAADGRVYCLRASDGALVWRFEAAPRDMRVVSYGQLESVWPVHGSVLVQDGSVYCVAGRSTFLDGGLWFYRLDAATGRVLAAKRLYDQQNPARGVKVLNMPVALTDILSSDGQLVYMRSQAFDLEGNRRQTFDPPDRATLQLGEGAHLFCPTGFLDNDAWHRSYWVYGRAFSSGCNWWYRAGRYAPAGRMLVFAGEKVYGFGREPGLFVWSHVLENHLFCAAKQASREAIARVQRWSKQARRGAIFDRQVTRAAARQDRLAPLLDWSIRHPPLHVRAMVLAGNTLLVAGPPDLLDEDAAFQRPFDPDVQSQKAAQVAAYAGQKGAMLLAVSANDGRTRHQIDLDAPPVWDGMAVADRRLVVATTDGQVICLAGKKAE